VYDTYGAKQTSPVMLIALSVMALRGCISDQSSTKVYQTVGIKERDVNSREVGQYMMQAENKTYLMYSPTALSGKHRNEICFGRETPRALLSRALIWTASWHPR
jgi:hypothetical protein